MKWRAFLIIKNFGKCTSMLLHNCLTLCIQYNLFRWTWHIDSFNRVRKYKFKQTSIESFAFFVTDNYHTALMVAHSACIDEYSFWFVLRPIQNIALVWTESRSPSPFLYVALVRFLSNVNELQAVIFGYTLSGPVMTTWWNRSVWKLQMTTMSLRCQELLQIPFLLPSYRKA